jgi:hypothetical protein
VPSHPEGEAQPEQPDVAEVDGVLRPQPGDTRREGHGGGDDPGADERRDSPPARVVTDGSSAHHPAT